VDAAHSFYSLMEALRLHEALESLSRGRVVLLVPRIPIKCPPAPYEAALLLHAYLTQRGVRAGTELEIWTVEPSPMATAGPAMGQRIVDELAERGIGFHPRAETAAVDGQRRAVRFADGTEISYDLLIAVPPHRVPRVVAAAGLAQAGGWVAVDPRTLEVKAGGLPPHVYAVGDVTSVPLPGRFDPAKPLVLPKAGTLAAAQGQVVGERIASALRGEPVTATFDGKGFCYIETGEGRAVRAEGAFFELPHPVMQAGPADEAQYQDKRAWEQSWLKSRR
jgi:sulfide:quinone oxidoreductase